MISEDGVKIRMPVLIVSESEGKWQVINSPLGWGKTMLEAAKKLERGSREINFNDQGVYLVVLNGDNQNILRIPVKIQTISLDYTGCIRSAKVKDGQSIFPKDEITELAEEMFTASEVQGNDNDEYRLAPELPKQSTNSEFAASEFQGASEALVAPVVKTKHLQTELALRRLVIKGKDTGAHQELLSHIYNVSRANDSSSNTSFMDTFRTLVDSASNRSELTKELAVCSKWREEHSSRNMLKQYFWADYYNDLACISWFISELESMLDKKESALYLAKRNRQAER
jgi:hypothetical protein